MSDRFEVQETPFAGLKLMRRKVLGDTRGSLERLYCTTDLAPLLGKRSIMQINRTSTPKRGTVRGLHYQRAPHAELKFVTCLRGRVFDVAVDLRRGSPTFLRWHGRVLSEEDPVTVVIPEGFAHGLQTLSDDCEMLYFHTAPYVAHAEGAVNPRDPRLAIGWPEEVRDISPRDAAQPMLDATFKGLDV